MSQVTLYKCDKCSKIITNSIDGLVIHGNIYVADPTTRGGLIGNNFPQHDDINISTLQDIKSNNFTEIIDELVKETIMCNSCFFQTCFPNSKIQTTR